MYYSKQFKQKPQGYDNVEVQKNLKAKTISLEDLANGLSHGTTFKPALLNGTKSIDWISQQVFALDFDHDTTIQTELDRCNSLQIKPVFGYTSFSHSEMEHHFRLVFCTDGEITDIDKRNKLQLALISVFDKSDVKTKDPARLFYGGTKLICSDYDNRIDADEIIARYYLEESPATKSKSKTSTAKDRQPSNPNANQSNSAAKVEAIKCLDVDTMRILLGEGVLGDSDKKESSSITITINPPASSSARVSVTSDKEYILFITGNQNPSADIDNEVLVYSDKVAPLIFKCQNDLYTYINQLNLNRYLGIGNNHVCCILPKHEDSKPSAHIYAMSDGTPIYKCFGCEKSRTIIGITEELSGCKRSEAIEFIKSVYNLKLEQSDWTLRQKQLMIDSANYLDTIEFKETFPELCKLIRTRKLHIKNMLMHFTQYVNEDLQVDGKPLFFASYPTLMGVCEIKANMNTLSQSLTLFTLLNMLDKIALDKIPEKELTKAKHIAAKYGHKKLTNFYSFEEYGINSLLSSEDIAKTLKQNNITLKGLSREYILRTFGTGLADKVYPQYKFENAKGTTHKSDVHTSQIVECVFYLIEKQNYSTEKAIVRLLGSKYQYQATEIQIKKSLQEILDSYGLQRVRANKELKEQYSIVGNGYPFIIIKDGE